MSKLFYEIRVEYNESPAEHEITVKVRSTRYHDGTEFHGKAIRPLLAKAAKWIEEK